MDTQSLPFKKMLFVCTHCRDAGERGCCADQGSIALHAELKQWVKDQKLNRYIRVCKSGCLDRCEEGPNMLILPENIWVSGLDAAGLEMVKKDLLAEFGGNI